MVSVNGHPERCKHLIFDDELLGKLVPCQQNLGMLCMINSNSVVFPNVHESLEMKKCGINPPTYREEKLKSKQMLTPSLLKMGKIDFHESQNKENITVSKRQKEFNFKWQQLLNYVLDQSWGNRSFWKIKNSTEQMMDKWLQKKSETLSFMRQVVGLAKEYNLYGTSNESAIKTIEETLKTNFTWLNAHKVVLEIHLCYRQYASSYVKTHSDFDATEENGLNGSSFYTYYFKMFCVKDGDAIAINMVGFYKRATLKATEKEIQVWVKKVYKDHVILTDKIPKIISTTDQVAREFTYKSVRYISQNKWSCWSPCLFLRYCGWHQVGRLAKNDLKRDWRVIALKKQQVEIEVKQRLIEVQKSKWIKDAR